MSRKRRLQAAATATLALILTAGCGSTEPAKHDSSPGRPAVPPTAAPAAPDGEHPWPNTTSWLSTLPDPRTVPRHDPLKVAAAYCTTYHTWDTTIDIDTINAAQRAALYATPALRADIEATPPGSAKGQATFTNARRHRTWTKTTITAAGREGRSDDPDKDSITLAWNMTLNRRDGTPANNHAGADSVQVQRTADGTWQVYASTERRTDEG
ncbi:hypothetical protein [Bifidobacterium xylocopae]|uniref:Uncharacterized protein n=1 Tax=Bifidobacterium xylocopae TaxID=2493119 RepID=A0A366KCA7_9BIFI|nr:hypothetical protein [Bifidobacterium xylocopae]RBP98818.1 hypothetical protein CRD59_07135 [Bifidobacterium xylocopae]